MAVAQLSAAQGGMLPVPPSPQTTMHAVYSHGHDLDPVLMALYNIFFLSASRLFFWFFIFNFNFNGHWKLITDQ
jgi:hypothetical protein